MSNCLIRSRDSFGGKVKILPTKKGKKRRRRDLSPFLARAVPRLEIEKEGMGRGREGRERRLIVGWCYEQ